MNNLSEDQLQAECFQWIWNTYPQTRRCIFAIPNGGKRSPTEAMKLRATGVVPGVHDILFVWNRQVYFMELKVGRNKQSADQILFGEAVKAQGAVCLEIRTFDEFKTAINHILFGSLSGNTAKVHYSTEF